MNVELPRAKEKYDREDAQKLRDIISQAVAKLYARGESIELWPETAIILRSPNGTRWKIQVSNAGALSAVAA